MEAPEERHLVRENVPDVHRVVQEEERSDVPKPLRAADPLRDAPALLANARRERIDKRPLEEIGDCYTARPHTKLRIVREGSS